MKVGLNSVSVMPRSLVSVGRSSSDVLWMANYYEWSNLTRAHWAGSSEVYLGISVFLDHPTWDYSGRC